VVRLVSAISFFTELWWKIGVIYRCSLLLESLKEAWDMTFILSPPVVFMSTAFKIFNERFSFTNNDGYHTVLGTSSLKSPRLIFSLDFNEMKYTRRITDSEVVSPVNSL
jgi:hypothetical protein